MKSTLRVYEIPACAGMKCSRVAPARNTRAKLGYVAGLEEPRKLGFSELINRASPYDANKFISAIFICVSRQRQLDLQTVSH